MVGSSRMSSILFTLVLLHHSFTPTATLHKTNQLETQLSSPNSPQPNPHPITTFFQVTKPIQLPNTKPCSSLILQHDFAYTYSKPPVVTTYNPPGHCPSQDFSKIVLEWKSTCKGRQFDRIFGVWLGGVELLRSCTAEPTATGIVWTVEKDVTRYSSLLKTPQTLAVYLGNLIDSTYTGVYHVNITFHYYPAENPKHQSRFKPNYPNLGSGHGSPADLVIPISRNLPLNDGQWFVIQNSADVQYKEFSIPRNAYKAALEVYISFHSSDESWYANPPNDYIHANNLSDTPGNGAFREVVISLDDKVVGAVFPFTAIYTGGVNPLFWRPITGIGSFDLPSYDIEITPYLGSVLDGKKHKFGFGVTNALDYWYVDANLHVWLDGGSLQTNGKLIEHNGQSSKVSVVSNFSGLNGDFMTTASRSIYSSGWLKSSYGNITTRSFRHLSFVNMMHMRKDGNLQIVNQTIDSNQTVISNLPSYIHTTNRNQSFPFYLYTDDVDQGNNSYTSIANVSLGFNEEQAMGNKRKGFLTSSLKNVQNAQGYMIVKGNLVTSGLGSTQQLYGYDGTDSCFSRNVSSSNYTVLYDESDTNCSGSPSHGPGFRFGRLHPYLSLGPFY